jgi:hypothetical protein
LWVRCAAGLIDLTILAIPFAVFVSFLSVGMGISNAFVDLNPAMPPNEILMRFGSRFLLICLCFFCGDGVAIFRDFRKLEVARYAGEAADGRLRRGCEWQAGGFLARQPAIHRRTVAGARSLGGRVLLSWGLCVRGNFAE